MKMPRTNRYDIQVRMAVTPDNGINIFDFSTLNVSYTGMLIASTEIIDIGTSYFQMAIDPFEQHFKSAILCDFHVVRIAEKADILNDSQRAISEDFKTLLGIRLYFRSYLDHKLYKQGLPDFLEIA